MIDIERSEELRKNLGLKKKSETEQQTKERMARELSARDEALKQIYEYQQQTGVPTQEETARNFFEIEANQKD